MNRPRRRVAICGVGMKTAAGTETKEVMDALLEGRSSAAPVKEFVERDLAVTFACRVPDFDTSRYLSLRESRQMERSAVLAMAAALDAVGDVPLETVAAPERIGVAVGAGAGGLTATEELTGEYGSDPGQMPAFSVPRTMASGAAARLSLRLGARGSALTYATACASGTNAIGEAVQKIRHGELDGVVAGGVEASVSPMVVSGFARMRALSQRNDEPAAACRPFDVERDGFVMAEGAAFLVLEEWEHAQARGATVLGEVLGYGSNSDAFHIVAPREDGRSAADCIRLALDDAGLAPEDVGHINAHGTSTVHNDRAEARAITNVFGDSGPPVTASKGVLGHGLGAAGAMEAAVTALSAASGLVPPVANFGRADEDTAKLDIVAGTPRKIGKLPALSNSFGFGGHNATLVIAP